MIEISLIASVLSTLQDDETFKHIAEVANLFRSGKLTNAIVPEECEAFNGRLAGPIRVANLLQSISDEMFISKDKNNVDFHVYRPEVVHQYNQLCGAILV